MRVVIIGGGVGGAAAAIALRRIGAEVTVCEAHPSPAGSVGSFVSLAVNGLRQLAVLDCLAPVQAAGIEVPRQRLWSGSGKLLGDVPRGRLGSDRLNSVTLRRGDLVELLRGRAERAGAQIVTGSRLTGAVPTERRVRARFNGGAAGDEATGGSVGSGSAGAGSAEDGSAGGGFDVDADLLLAADGLWSTTRRLIDPAAPTPKYAGMYSVSGVAEGLEIPPGVFNLVFARNGAFLYLAAGDGTIWWSAQVSQPEPPADLAAVDLPTLAHLFRHEELPTAILRSSKELQAPTLQHVLAPVPVWHTATMALLGDAAHPVGAGQGASMALEDAVVLADRLATATDLQAGLAEYVRARRARTAKMIKAASANRDAKTAGPIGRVIRDAVMPFALRHFYEKGTAWLYTDTTGTGADRQVLSDRSDVSSERSDVSATADGPRGPGNR